MQIQLTDIEEGIRAREDYGNIEQFAESIKAIGLIQPIVLNKASTEDGKYQLVAGGRRFRALQLLGVSTLTQGVTCNPDRIGFVFAEDLTDAQKFEIELEENLQRRAMKWTEEVLLIAKTHKAKSREAALNGTSWGVRQVGQLFNKAAGYISHILHIAELLQQNDPQILAATSVSDAVKVLLQRKEDAASVLLARATGATPVHSSKPKARTDSSITIEIGDSSDINIDLGSEAGPTTRSSNGGVDIGDLLEGDDSRSKIEQESPKAQGFDGVLEVPFSKMFFCGDSIKGEDGRIGGGLLFTQPSNSVDHIITDIPYGIDMANLQVNNQERIEEEHDVEDNVALMRPFLEQSFRIIKDNGYLVFWYDLDHHEKLMAWGEEIGFKVQHWPLIWIKTHPTKNRVTQFNWTKRTEFAMVMRKGKATLTKPQAQNYIICDGAVERKMYANPFAKPFDAWKFILDAVAIRGQTILDPYAGEFSSIRAFINCGMRPLAFELKEYHYNRGVEHARAVYQNLTRNKAVFV